MNVSVRNDRIQAVVLDLDGTLLNSDKQISDRNYKAILNCYRQGMNIIFATARPPRAVRSFLQDELLRIGSFIYYNGAYISCIHTGTHYHEPIEASITAEVLDYLIRINSEIDVSLEVRDEWMSLKEYDYSTIMKVKGNPIVKTLNELRKQDATKILFSGKMDIHLLREKFASHLNILVTDQGGLVQITSSRASKENAVALLCSRLNIPLEQVIVFGDDYNDVGLFGICGWPVAMGNAIEELKEMAEETTDTNDNDGVAKVLERILCEP